MSGQAIIERIISDAEEEAKAIIENAEQKAAETVENANLLAERNRQGTKAEVTERIKSITDGKSATARLDGAKILLGEKRGVIDEIYARALARLNGLGKPETLHLAEKLLKEYAEEGDEIAFAENFRYAEDASTLGVVKEKRLKVSMKRVKLDGGFMLYGKNSDKNLSYSALLSADREEHQAEIAAHIFHD